MSIALTPKVALAVIACITLVSLAWILLRSQRDRQVKRPSDEAASTDPTLLTDAGSLASVGCFILAMLTFLAS